MANKLDTPENLRRFSRTDVFGDAHSALGIDNEVVLVKRRKPTVKLDDNLLLSPAGLPKLRKVSRNGFKLNGKRHEYSDVAQLLKMYQIWLDDLYPKAKFADGLTMIEKLGHSKRVQLYRKQWIDEAKPNQEETRSNIVEDDTENKLRSERGSGITPSVERRQDDNEYLTENMTQNQQKRERETSREPSVPESDELDMLLYDNA